MLMISNSGDLIMSNINKEIGLNIILLRKKHGIIPASIAMEYSNLEYSRLEHTIVLNKLWQMTTYLKE